ncbi:MAG: cryptochrome/photolyase family protein [Candidatus Puniceispirillum sp.]|nr:cryptochrome/photolyase family protein [Candidatus Puniceispirillum sp.]
MSALRIVLWDQLSHTLSALKDAQAHDVVLFCETHYEASLVPHHPKKLAFLYAAMRHFAQELCQKGLRVRYVTLDATDNTGMLASEITRAVKDLGASHIIMTQPSEYALRQDLLHLFKELTLPFEMREDDRFLCSEGAFKNWAAGRKELRMEYFYRDMRKHYRILMDKGDKPLGGQWNFDKENRRPPECGLSFPKRLSHPRSDTLKEVLRLVGKHFPGHFGDLEPFYYAVTREQALLELEDFIIHCLPFFGDYQDAMVRDEPYLFHSLLSSYLNAGLLAPLEICRRAERVYLEGKAPLNCVEGFIRQILGWREFIRGVYWLKMPAYGDLNYLEANGPLPSFYWGGPTHMACIKEAVTHTRIHAYSHHIQRLMVTGNFALLAGLDVAEVQAWYLSVYSDAFEWVEMPNTLGMALFGDGGLVGSKPYAASGKYIHKMSNFCAQCPYNPDGLLEEDACPFNALYWDFLARHRQKLDNNPRLSFSYKNWDRFDTPKQEAIRHKAKQTLLTMKEETL